ELIMDLGLLYRALIDRRIDVAVGNTTDAQIERLRLATLGDDHSAFPPYEAGAVVRDLVVHRSERLHIALNRLAGSLSLDGMRHLNAQVDALHRSPREVVTEFLNRPASTACEATRFAARPALATYPHGSLAPSTRRRTTQESVLQILPRRPSECGVP